MKTDILVNGVLNGSVNPQDRGLQYGDGLFETILIESGCAVFLQEHLERLQKGCEALAFPKLDREVIISEVSQLISDKQSGVIKITLTRGVGERGFLPPISPNITRLVSYYPSDAPVRKSLTSMALLLCETRLARQPLLAGIKHLNQLERVLARAELRGEEQLEGLMLDTEGAVIEGTMSNLFIVKDDALITPKLNSCGVAGVIRQVVIQQARKEGVVCKEAILQLDDVKNSDEIFMTNSLMPVRFVDQLRLNGVVFDKSGSYAAWALDSVLKAMQQELDMNFGRSI
ncbi:MAG: 4-amino-4-deoxychorismate lyase [Cycloclasticus sp. symbiont of Poecilosclerida sp. N]|nr:MAG: 4-amino-4-deoxychorismate lyase [Cycloclasticus sp. symbiont of Poecilosclerida sp. N]